MINEDEVISLCFLRQILKYEVGKVSLIVPQFLECSDLTNSSFVHDNDLVNLGQECQTVSHKEPERKVRNSVLNFFASDIKYEKRRSQYARIFFFKWANLGLFFVYFRSFQTNITIFTICEKMSIQYTVLGFEPTTFGTWVSSHNH